MPPWALTGETGALIGGAFGGAPHAVKQRADQQVGLEPMPKSPIAAKPPPCVLVGGCGAHQARQQRPVRVQFAYLQVVDGLAERANSITGRQNFPTKLSAISCPGRSPSRTQPPSDIGIDGRSRTASTRVPRSLQRGFRHPA